MNKSTTIFTIVMICLIAFFALYAQEAKKQKVIYKIKYKDPVLEKIRENNKQRQKDLQEETNKIREAQEESKEKRKQEEKEIRFDFTNIQKPASPDIFEKAFHFPPIRQYLTGTCWCFSTTSFLESEVYRLTGQKIKLSEMYTVYHEFLEKAQRYVKERGDSYFNEGSEGNVVMKIWEKYGVVPAEAYRGILKDDNLYDHSQMVSEMKAYLKYIKDHDFWNEDLVLESLKVIMNKYMDQTPERFFYNGKEMTPRQFLADVLKLNLDDYVVVISTLSYPFYAYGEYEVKANWWHSKDYYNVPLDQFYQIIKYAIRNDYTVRLNGDVSEPGYNGFEDAAIIPSFDIPREYIDQDAREFRFFNETTGDDHDVHLVGYTKIGDDYWFLIKDSASSAQHGKFKGYYFYREDYIKLKILTYIVHKDAVKAVINDFQ